MERLKSFRTNVVINGVPCAMFFENFIEFGGWTIWTQVRSQKVVLVFFFPLAGEEL